MKQMFVQRVKEKEAILKEAEREVNVVQYDLYLFLQMAYKIGGLIRLQSSFENYDIQSLNIDFKEITT